MDQRELILSGEWARRLTTLSAGERRAFEWVRAGNAPHDLANATGFSKQTIRNQLLRARAKMLGAVQNPRGRPRKAA